MDSQLKKTPLYDRHVVFGGKMIDFGGWSLPVQYKSILEEHVAVRTKVGLFDVSHMGEIEVTGPDAGSFLDWLLTADLDRLTLERAVYSLMCQPDGGVVDDLIVYQLGTQRYLLVVNAGCKDKDLVHILEKVDEWNARHDDKTVVTDRSQDFAQIALQGPEAVKLVEQFSHLAPVLTLRPFHHMMIDMCHGVPAFVSRTGYTGEDGFEFYCSPDAGVALFDWLAAAGATPCGLGARDSLRFEAGMPLYGHELSATITPLEAGLGRFVALGKKRFIGSEALSTGPEALPVEPSRRLVGLAMTGRAIPRAGYAVTQKGLEVGTVTSGMFSPTLERGLAMALVKAKTTAVDSPPSVVIRGREEPAELVPLPFYKRPKKTT